jgi:hypothetical protein
MKTANNGPSVSKGILSFLFMRYRGVNIAISKNVFHWFSASGMQWRGLFHQLLQREACLLGSNVNGKTVL